MTPRRAAVHLTVVSVLALSAVAAVLLDAPRPVQIATVTASSITSAVITIRADHPPSDDSHRRQRRKPPLPPRNPRPDQRPKP